MPGQLVHGYPVVRTEASLSTRMPEFEFASFSSSFFVHHESSHYHYYQSYFRYVCVLLCVHLYYRLSWMTASELYASWADVVTRQLFLPSIARRA